MSIYAISDLHLSFAQGKDMDIFGQNWHNHHEKIEKSWRETVKPHDLVLLPGDLSWALNISTALPDLEFVENLPGKKVLIKGNHDFWWKSVSQLNGMFESMFFLQNNSCFHKDFAICGARGWVFPSSDHNCEDEKIFRRELLRLENSLNHAVSNGATNIIVMLHFPPTSGDNIDSLVVSLIKQYPVKHVIYGHLHGEDFFKTSLIGRHFDINFSLVSSDFLNFSLYMIDN